MCGIQKGAPTTGYVSSRTYSFPWANPDGILHENFGTTDVNIVPGTYFLYANDRAFGCNHSPHFADLGDHTFFEDQVTYVGLHPSWLPTVRPSSGTIWDAQIFIRNHAPVYHNQSNTSFVAGSSLIGQRNWTTMPMGTAIVSDEPSNTYMGIVVPSQDSSVLGLLKRNGQPAGYTSIISPNVSNSLNIQGWEQAGGTLYAPLIKKNWVTRYSEIYVTNVGTSSTTLYVTYYNQAGTGYDGGSYTLAPNTRKIVRPGSNISDGLYSAILTNSQDQPLAAVILEGNGSSIGDWPAMYNAFSSGGTTLYGPLIKKNYNGSTTGITLQNVHPAGGSASFVAYYYDMSGVLKGSVSGSIPYLAPYVLYNPTAIPDGFLGSVRIVSTNSKELVGQMSEGNGNGDWKLMSNLALGGSATVYLPLWYEEYEVGGNWMSGVNVRNAHTAGQSITATWYDHNGNVALVQTATLTNSNDAHTFYDPPLDNFIGSVVITSNIGKPIVAVSNVRNLAGAGTDTVMAFNGSNR